MIPENRLLSINPLYSGRGQTFYTPETLFLSIGIGQPKHAEDSAIGTLIHEGIHWRQFQGTTFGAFCQWLKHSQEIDTYRDLGALPMQRKRELLIRRAAGVPILSLDPETNLPHPPIPGAALTDPVNLLRIVWYDRLFTYRYFRDSSDIKFEPDPPREIFASAIADAATGLVHAHPAWAGFAYEDVQKFYTLDEVGPVKGLGRELTTKDLLEAAAAASEVFFRSLFSERRFLLTLEGAENELRQAANEGREPDVAPRSNVSPRDNFEPEIFRTAARQTLESSYGYALWEFFAAAALPPDRPESWATALAVIDFALNGPLPPHVLPGQRQPQWWDLYPPARFLRASAAVPKCRRLGFLPKPHRFPMFFDDLAGAAGLSNPLQYDRTGIFDAKPPDFEAIKRGEVWEQLLGTPTNYYTFLRWCQQSLCEVRTSELARAIAPIFPMWDLVKAKPATVYTAAMRDAEAFFGSKFGHISPMIMASDGEIEHGLGSTSKFGTWLATSVLVFHATWELMVGVGKPEFAGFPPRLLTNENVTSLVDSSIRKGLGIAFSPWEPELSAGAKS